MTTNPTFRPPVNAAREQLAEGRRRIHQQHDAGSPGIQVCAALTELLDEVVLEVYNAALLELRLRKTIRCGPMSHLSHTVVTAAVTWRPIPTWT